jgi:ATP-dependent Clp protease adaptor protein ClpS
MVSVLKTCVGLSEADAIRTMLDIHRKGGILLPMHSFEESSRVAELVTTEARLKASLAGEEFIVQFLVSARRRTYSGLSEMLLWPTPLITVRVASD